MTEIRTRARLATTEGLAEWERRFAELDVSLDVLRLRGPVGYDARGQMLDPISRDSIRRIRNAERVDEVTLIQFYHLVGIRARPGKHYEKLPKGEGEDGVARLLFWKSPYRSPAMRKLALIVSSPDFATRGIAGFVLLLILFGGFPLTRSQPPSPEDRFRHLLSASAADAPAIERIFGACDLFTDQFDGSDVEAVAGVSATGYLPRLESAGLLEKADPGLWRLPEECRPLAEETLRKTHEGKTFRDRYDTHYVTVLRNLGAGIETGKSADMRGILAPRQKDWQAVCQHLIDTARSPDRSVARRAAEAFHSMRFALQNYEWFANWNPKSVAARGRVVFANAAAWGAAGDCEVATAMWDFRAGYLAEAKAGYARAVEDYRRSHDTWARIDVMRTFGDIYVGEGKISEARKWAVAALGLCRPSDGWLKGECHRVLGDCDRANKDLTAAARDYQSALDIFRQVGALGDVATCQQAMARMSLDQGRLPLAQAQTRATVATFRANGDLNGLTGSLIQGADIDRRLAKQATGVERATLIRDAREEIRQARAENLQLNRSSIESDCAGIEVDLDTLAR